MDSNKLNIIIETGTDFIMTMTLYDEDENALDLTGATIRAKLREYPEHPDYFDFVVSHNNKGGQITLQMARNITSRIPYSYGVYDIFLKMSNGKVYRPLYGDVIIRPGVTMEANGNFYYIVGYDSVQDFPYPGNPDYLYIDKGTGNVYIWDGDGYREVRVKMQDHPTYWVNVDTGHLFMYTEDDYRYPDFFLSADSGHFSVVYME